MEKRGYKPLCTSLSRFYPFPLWQDRNANPFCIRRFSHTFEAWLRGPCRFQNQMVGRGLPQLLAQRISTCSILPWKKQFGKIWQQITICNFAEITQSWAPQAQSSFPTGEKNPARLLGSCLPMAEKNRAH